LFDIKDDMNKRNFITNVKGIAAHTNYKVSRWMYWVVRHYI